jgi:hypothetical protein
MIANGRYGRPYNASRKRISALSTWPPRNPAVAPYKIPTTMIAKVAAKPIANDTRPPRAVRTRRSRPNPSVPNGCSQLGDWYACEKSSA